MKKNNRVLAIDPGTHYIGVAVLDGAKLAYYGVKTLSHRKSPHDILVEGRKLIRELIDDFKPKTLAVEKTFFANNRNSALLNVFADEIVAIGKKKSLKVILLAANVVRKKSARMAGPRSARWRRRFAADSLNSRHTCPQTEGGRKNSISTCSMRWHSP